jgi:hypothetical protein
MGFKRSRVQIPAARFSDAWENFFGLKRFAKMRGFGGFSVRGEFAVMGVWRRDLRFSFGCKALAEKCQRVLVIPAD